VNLFTNCRRNKNFACIIPWKTAVITAANRIKQEEQLAANPDIITATPGRFIDFLNKKIQLSNIRFLILDEPDRMFDMGFLRDIRFIMKRYLILRL